jgi:predicted AAA+ superfamily ATPase
MAINRFLEKNLLKRWDDKKVLVVIGPRQVGKTTLIQKICEEKGEFLFLNGDDLVTRQLLNDFSKKKLEQIIGAHKTLFIDEAQRIENIGLAVKIIYDQLPGIKVILSGSSALDLNATIKEPLTGRKWAFEMYPISWQEYVHHTNFVEAYSDLDNRLIYGMYPEVLTHPHDAYEVLNTLASSYLYKDLFEYQSIKNHKILMDLLKALALQVGAEVSFNELAQLLQIDRATVEKYIDLLEKTFVVFKLQALNNNQRNEIKNSRKIYFYDNGIRNAIINNFNPINLRNDVGALWENFIISERMKVNAYQNKNLSIYFWRNYHGQEIDYIESHSGQYFTFEIKWNSKKKAKLPSNFEANYPQSTFDIINKDNFTDFLL